MIKKFVIILSAVVMLTSCSDDGINFFTLNQDKQFGEQLDSTVLATPSEYKILSETQYAAAYTHLNRILGSLKQSNDLRYAQTFPWKVRIIHNDTVLNAFAAPGGYMYFYTGIIKYLDNEAQFAGVMAHEMAHADRRHSTQMLTRQYGFSMLASLILGENPSQLKQIVAQLALGGGMLKYSRTNEYEADEYAVRYLYDTDYHPRELAGFFEKMEGSANKVPEFLSTHPSPDNRVEAIEKVWNDLGGKSGELFVDRYNQFKSSLP